MMKTPLLLAVFVLITYTLSAQQVKRVLFLGNSYTAANNLPQMLADVALSLGDTLVFDSNTPGGYTFQGHTSNALSQSKIAQGNWDVVVLQEQSQLPAFPFSQFSTQSLPFALLLTQQVRASNSCTLPLFYMTWGRQNGDLSNCANYPPLCTYQGMQAELRARYLLMADSSSSAVAPVGAVWRDVRSNFPGISLYQTDESHPSVEGSYLAACTFYASIFHKSPVGASKPFNVSAQDAQIIQQQAAYTVFDSLGVWMLDTLTPQVSFVQSHVNLATCTFYFDATSSLNVDSVYWDFGTGVTGASGFQVSHQFSPGVYIVQAFGYKGCLVDTMTFLLNASCSMNITEDVNHQIEVLPNPAKEKIRLARYNQRLQNGTFTVLDSRGAAVLTGTELYEIDIQALPSGLYHIEIHENEKFSRARFIKL